VVSAQDATTLDIVAEVYGSVVKAGIHRAPSIKVAEAAKVIENTQRDLNIAFMNELSAIFHQLGIDTGDVLAAAATKWNFVNYQPGLVGGHCIGVDPYYLTFRAEKAGYHPEIILAGRRINDRVGQWIAHECVRSLTLRHCTNALVTVLGMTFKENVPDIRNSRVIDIVRELERFGIRVQVHDPLAMTEETENEYGVKLMPMGRLGPADAVILAVAHRPYVTEGWPLMTRLLRDGKGTVIDVKCKLDRACTPEGIDLWRL
jgi:UDP-N-acetyl-D-galactosamine dehydrogenase